MKQCLVDCCSVGQFGGGYCKSHQYKRTDKANKARNRAVEPQSPLQVYKLSTSAKQELVTNKKELLFSFGFKTQRELFGWIWETRERKCIFTGEDLTKTNQFFWSWQFMHILPKSTYPLWKYNPDNIVLGFPEFHTAADNFCESERTKHPEWDFGLWFSMQFEMKQKYEQFLKLNNI